MTNQKEQSKQLDKPANTNDVIEAVETFIHHLRDLDYIVAPEGNKMRYSQKSSGYDVDIGTLPDLLAQSISKYEAYKYNTKERLYKAIECLAWINRAYTSGIITEGNGLLGRFKECSEQNMKLESELQDLSSKYLILQGKYQELKQQMEEAIERGKYS